MILNDENEVRILLEDDHDILVHLKAEHRAESFPPGMEVRVVGGTIYAQGHLSLEADFRIQCPTAAGAREAREQSAIYERNTEALLAAITLMQKLSQLIHEESTDGPPRATGTKSIES